MAITFFGVASTPADNSTNTASPTVVTPPGSMAAGDLVILIAQSRATTGTLSMSQAGGQSWTSETQQNQTTCRRRVFWCRFNGTWGANPSVTMGATTCNQVVMLVFRPSYGENTWAVDTAFSNSAVTAPGSPYTVTLTGFTPANDNNVIVAMWAAIAANTWGSLSGTNWVKTSLGAQYRCTSGSGESSSFAYQIQGTKAASNNVSQNESAGTTGAKSTEAWYESVPTLAPAEDAQAQAMDVPTLTVVSAFQKAQTGVAGSAASGTTVSATLGSNPAAGSLITVGVLFYDGGTTPPVMTVKDEKNNSYTVEGHNSGSTYMASSGWVGQAYLLSAPANAGKIITATFNKTIGGAAGIWVDNWTVTGGSAAYDDGAYGYGTGTINTPTIPVNHNDELVYCTASDEDSVTAAGSPFALNEGGLKYSDGSEWATARSSSTAAVFTGVSLKQFNCVGMSFYAVITLAPAENNQAQTLDVPTLELAGTNLVAQENSQTQGMDTLALGQLHILAPDEDKQAEGIDACTLIFVMFVPAEDAQAQAIDGCTLIYVVFAPAENAQAQALDVPSLTQVHVLVAQESGQAQVVDASTLIYVVLAPAECSQIQAFDAPALTQVHVLAPAECAQAQALDVPTITEVPSGPSQLDPAEDHQAQGVDVPSLTQLHIIECQENSQAQAQDAAALTQLHILAGQENAQAQGVDQPALVQLHVMAPQENAQAQTVDAPALDVSTDLAPYEAHQAQAVDDQAITQVHVLTAAGSRQAQTIDLQAINQTHWLVVAGITQFQAIDAVSVAVWHLRFEKILLDSKINRTIASSSVLGRSIVLKSGLTFIQAGNSRLTREIGLTSGIEKLIELNSELGLEN